LISIDTSRGSHRLAVLTLILTGMGVSVYLGLFQLRVLRSVWDPVFGVGSVRVLESGLSRALPLPDSLLGAFGYFCESVAFTIGGKNRFGAYSWCILIYAIIALGMGAVSLGLVMDQTFVIRNGCALCLFSALLSIILVVPALQEAFPAILIVKERRNRGESWCASLRFLTASRKRSPSDAQAAA
jgi:uncharacterized membrane protein